MMKWWLKFLFELMFSALTAKSDKAFEDAVDAAIESLPQFVRDLPNCPKVFILECPTKAITKLCANSPRLAAGLEANYVHPPANMILLYRRNIRRVTPDELLALKVKHIVWHEIAHFLGFKEHEIRELGLYARNAADLPKF